MKTFWNEYWNSYHPVHSYMNWANNTMNNAGGWPSCFDWMNAHSFNNVWLCAYNTGDESVIQNWCLNAWTKSWLYRLEYYVSVYWRCTGTCTTCKWPNGDWEISNIYYNFSQWVGY